MSGWGFFAMANIYIASLLQELSLTIFWLDILLALLGFVCSHVYRKWIHANHWKLLPTEIILLKSIIASFILSLVFNSFYYIIIRILQYFNVLTEAHSIHLGTVLSVFVLFAMWNLIYFAWHYIERNRLMVIEHLQIESQMKDLEIKTIKANLQPHFIFNSLNSIRALIDENPNLARDAITKISRILRQTIQQKEATDTLLHELQLANDYLDLEKIRFEERLSLREDIDEKTLSFKVPTMMLQTLVENAIKHGISKRHDGGEIFITTKYENGILHIQIRNSGKLLYTQDNETSLGFGLSSTRQRLALLYKSKATISISEADEFVYVDIHIKNPTT